MKAEINIDNMFLENRKTRKEKELTTDVHKRMYY